MSIHHLPVGKSGFISTVDPSLFVKVSATILEPFGDAKASA
jgi:hypothetical protein